MFIKKTIHVIILLVIQLVLLIFFPVISYCFSDSHNNLKIVKTIHFDIYFPEYIADLAVHTAKIAEESYVYLANSLKHELSRSISIIIDPANHGQDKENYYYSKKSADEMLLSFNGSYASYHEDLTRKLAYSFQYDVLFDSAPGWEISPLTIVTDYSDVLVRGNAAFLSEGYDKNTDCAVREILGNADAEKYFNIGIFESGKYKDLQTILYKSFLYFIETQINPDFIPDILINIKTNSNLSKAIESAARKSKKDLNEGWKAFYEQRHPECAKENLPGEDLFFPKNDIMTLSIESSGGNEIIAIYDIKPRRKKAEIILPFTRIRDASLSADGKHIVFSGQSYASSNIFIYNIEDKSLTRITNDLFYKRFPKISADNSSVVFLSNENPMNAVESKIFRFYKFDLLSNIKTSLNKPVANEEITAAAYRQVNYTEPYFAMEDIVLKDYRSTDLNFSMEAAAIAWDKSFAGSGSINAQDYLREHKFRLDYEFLKNKSDKNQGYYFDYKFSKYRAETGFGSFYASNPFRTSSFYRSSSIAFFPNNIDAISTGIFGYLSYRFTEKLSAELKETAAAYNNIKSTENTYKDIFSNELSFSTGYNSLVRNKLRPVSGTKCEVTYSHSFEGCAGDVAYSRAAFILENAFSLSKRLTLDISAGAGKIFGEDRHSFNYYAGGPGSIRGHSLFAYSGQNAALLNLEMRFIIFSRLTTEFPFAVNFNDISLALFADFGSVWNNDFRLMSSETGEFEDMKSGLGTGLRFLMLGHLSFKIDAAWKYYYKSFGKCEVSSGFEFLY